MFVVFTVYDDTYSIYIVNEFRNLVDSGSPILICWLDVAMMKQPTSIKAKLS